MRAPLQFDISVVPASVHGSQAASFNIGVITFDVLIPAGAQGSPGVNVFNIVNLTGDPTASGSALAPDFPVFTQLTWSNCRLSVVVGGSPTVIPLTPVGPGTFSGPAALQFPDTTQIDSATFTATLNTGSLLLSGGTTVPASSSQVTATLLPTALLSGRGVDFAVIGVTGAPTLTVVKSHAGDFTQGQAGATYSVTVNDVGWWRPADR